MKRYILSGLLLVSLFLSGCAKVYVENPKTQKEISERLERIEKQLDTQKSTQKQN